MANYLLLRNNKESGPYSLDDLIELGLKPYDLIWVQGKSAAWRYPSEVEELKPIAPAVEEQPFDRFFKKAEERKEIPVVAEQTAKIIAESRKPEIAEIKPEYEKYIPKKSVYVAMPGQKDTAAKEPVKETQPFKELVKETQPFKETVAAAIPVQPTITVSENPVAAQVKYSQPLDEIKEMYVKTLNNRKQKIARKSFWMQSLKKTAALLSLVAVGLIAGFVIKSNGNKQKEIVQQQNISSPQPVKSEPVAAIPEVNKPDTVIAATGDVQPLRQPTGGYVNKSPVLQNNNDAFESAPITEKPVNNSNNSKKEIVTTPQDDKPINSLAAQGVETDPTTGERNRKVRSRANETDNNNSTTAITEKDERKSFLSDRISRLVSVKSNEYKRVAFGGIRDLQLTVTNDSKYVLDNVTVELQYIKPNELPLKTENIQFTSIGPNATSTIRVPDTNRGIKVFFRIVNVKSRQMDEVAGNQ